MHELVGVLVERGYLRPDPETSTRFVLGVRAFQLGGAYEREVDLFASGRAAAKRVAAECGETVQVVIRDDRHVIYIVKVDSIHAVRVVSHVGGRLPAWCTAGGKVLLSQLSPDELDALFPHDIGMVGMTAQSIRSRKRLVNELKITRERGWGEENSESNEDAACVAAPIYDRSGACVAAMSITVPIIRWDNANTSRFVDLVVQGALEASTDLGWVSAAASSSASLTKPGFGVGQSQVVDATH